MFRRYAEYRDTSKDIVSFSYILRSAVFMKDSPAYISLSFSALSFKYSREIAVTREISSSRNSERSPAGQLRLSLHGYATWPVETAVMDPSPTHVINIMDAQHGDIT